jgi:hypothetical protein
LKIQGFEGVGLKILAKFIQIRIQRPRLPAWYTFCVNSYTHDPKFFIFLKFCQNFPIFCRVFENFQNCLKIGTRGFSRVGNRLVMSIFDSPLLISAYSQTARLGARPAGLGAGSKPIAEG